MKKIFIFNSPPNSGKDVVAHHISKTFGFEVLSFKERLIEITQAVYGVSKLEWDLLYTREGKETPHWKLRNSRKGVWMSPRQALIYISEEVIKPRYGKDYFGVALSNKIEDSDCSVFLIPDGGFVEEVKPLIEKFGKENITKVKVVRDGCTFEGDSRKDIDDSLFSNTLILNNNSNLDNLLWGAEEVFMKGVYNV